VAETERDLADCVGAIYEAAADHGSWLDVGARMCRVFNAPRAMLWVNDRPGGPRNVLMPPDDGESVYAAHFFRIDPYVAQARGDFADARSHHLGRAKVGAELVPERSFLRSEYYNDFARLHGRRHLIGGMAGLTEAIPLGLYRGERKDPFGERDVHLLQALLPHIQRALELQQRLAREEHAVGLTRALLDTLPVGVGVVDAGLKLQFVNDIARNYLAGTGAGLCSMRSGPSAGGGVYLAASSREVATVLRRLVAAATSGKSGGSMRVTSRDGAVAAVLISPMPQSLADDVNGAGTIPKALALVVIRPLDKKPSPPSGMLCDFFGLSRAEAEVATALSGGASAEDVACQRGVSLVTVRSQIRSILAKSSCENLRDLERAMATLAALAPRER
jgi:DNA-binding NarL/FixJ family response regulator/PAS domain-containing protein